MELILRIGNNGVFLETGEKNRRNKTMAKNKHNSCIRRGHDTRRLKTSNRDSAALKKRNCTSKFLN